MDLYRFYDGADRLLYVGISVNAALRSKDHSKEKAWWPEVARMEVEHLAVSTRSEAEAIEKAAIVTERPLHNVVHNGRAVADVAAGPKLGARPWLCSCGQYVIDGFLTRVGSWGEWVVTCQQCDDDLGGYWVSLDQVSTEEDVRRFTTHLMGKRWFVLGQWEEVIRKAKSNRGGNLIHAVRRGADDYHERMNRHYARRTAS